MSIPIISQLPRHQKQPSQVVGASCYADKIIEGFKLRDCLIKSKDRTVISASVLNSNYSKVIDISWLAAASETYKISANIKDYVIVDVPIVTVDVPNRNMHCFPYEEVSYFDPMHGKMIYQTFIGKPTYLEHANQNPLEAKGVHIDATLDDAAFAKYGVWKIRVLAAFDRTKDSFLANSILRGDRRGYSMGALVENFINTITGKLEGANGSDYPKKGTIVNGMLTYSLCAGVQFFESSSVGDPADPTATSDKLW